jgi:hypothetical protein
MASLLKKMWASIAGWKTLSTIDYIESYCSQNDPLFEENVTLPADLTEKVFLFDSENAIKKAKKDLWEHITNKHGGPWNGLQSSFTCYNSQEHEDIRETLEFWIRNNNRLKKGLPPITNPLYLT